MDSGQTKPLLARAVARPQRGVSASALDKRLSVRKRAREDAARNLPRQDANELSAVELAILEAVAAERRLVDEARGEAKAETERRLRTLAPTPQDFSGPALDARLELKQVAGRLARDWAEASRQAAEAHEELKAFKQQHRLRRGAAYPSSTLLQAGLLLCAATFEALFSAALFAEDDARGLLGGAVTAIGLSGANVSLGFLAGFLGLRYLQHERMPIKSAGAAGFGVLAVLALMLNLFAADWRDRLAAQAGRTPPDADASFHLWSLLQLDSPQAIILLMLGAGVWVFAALKGYSGFDDPYPEYGRMARAARDAEETLSAFRAEAHAQLETPVNAARVAVGGRVEKMRAEFEAMNRAFDAAAAKMERLDAQALALDDTAAAAVHLYRQENTAHRTTPAPTYFSVAPPAAGPALDPLGVAAKMVSEARARLTEAQTQAARALEELSGDLDAITQRLDVAP